MSKVDKTLKSLQAPTQTEDDDDGKRSWRDPRLSIIGFFCAVLVVAAVVVGVGHLLYLNSSGYKLDLTRPDLSDIKKGDLVEVNRNQDYDTTGPIDATALKSEQKSIEGRLQELDRYGDFADDELLRMQESVVNEATGSSL